MKPLEALLRLLSDEHIQLILLGLVNLATSLVNQRKVRRIEHRTRNLQR